MIRQDALYTDDGVLRIENNDLVFGDSDAQHIEDTVIAAPGWWKETFSDGVNIRKYLNSDGQEQVLTRNIKLQLTADQYFNCSPVVKFDPNGKLNVNPNVVVTP